jgi:rhodanese-related sulfurtransferase
VLDVREPSELQTASVKADGFRAARHPMNEVPARLSELDSGRPIACLCHHGRRSQMVAMFLAGHGFARVANIAGGIDAGPVKSTPACRSTESTNNAELSFTRTDHEIVAAKFRLVPLAAALGVIFAAPVQAESLLEMYESARAYDATWQSAKAQYDANLYRAEQAKAGILPAAGLGASVSRSNFDSIEPASLRGERQFTAQSATVSASQPLYRPSISPLTNRASARSSWPRRSSRPPART